MDRDNSKDKVAVSALELDKDKKHLTRAKLTQLCVCPDVVSAETINVIGNVVNDVRAADDNAPDTDELDEDVEEEYRDLNADLELPDDTYSLVEFRPELPSCVKYGVRSGMTHMNLPKFSPLSRGHQGGAIAVAAFAATAVFKSRCWNEAVIDQIVEDGDTFYCESYKHINTDDRRLLSILDLKRDMFIQQKLNVNVQIEDPSYAGKFRSDDPKELHLVKALDLFFKRHNAGILSSPVLDVAIWKDPRYFNIFDAQARKESCEPAGEGGEGTAKLFLVKDMIGVLFILLEKSNVNNEPFVLYPIAISGVEPFSLADDPDEPEKLLGKPQRRPSGYKILQKFRAVVQGSYHIMHTSIPEMLRGRGHLVIALAALIYSRLVNGNKWTSALLDLIFNQANIYLVDLVRVLEKKFDPDFELRAEDLMGDVILGAYSAKIKIRINAIPGYGKKRGKVSIDGGIREFFETQVTGILEIKKFFYGIWREDDTYYFLDPFACDDEGFRINFADTTRVKRTDMKEAACVTMNSSVNEMVETILENTGNKDKDPFFIHGVKVLYVKTGTIIGSPFEKVIYREKGTGRRPLPPQLAMPEPGIDKTTDMAPKERPGIDKMFDNATQVPDLMKYVETYMKKEDEPDTFLRYRKMFKEPEAEDEEEEDDDDDDRRSTALSMRSIDSRASRRSSRRSRSARSIGDADRRSTARSMRSMGSMSSRRSTSRSMRSMDSRSSRRSTTMSEESEEEEIEEDEDMLPPIVLLLTGYSVINAHRLVLQGTKNCLEPEFRRRSQGQQGVIMALAALSYRRLKHPPRWRNVDIDQIIDLSAKAFDDVIEWIKSGRPPVKLNERKSEGEEGDEEEDVEEEEEEARKPQPAPSHLELSMLPIRVKLGEDDIFFKSKMNVIGGEANPLANLAEALECYFNRYSDVILENKKLMYGIWKESEKYFLFNPYGSDKEGWRVRDYPGALIVTDNLNELVDVLYGLLEFNDHAFALHFIGIDAIQPGKYFAPEKVIVPEDDFEAFKTTFLPITDDDLDDYDNDRMQHMAAAVLPDESLILPTLTKDELGEDEEGETADDEDIDAEEGPKAIKDPPMICSLVEVPEGEQSDAPYHLNLLLLTTKVKLEDRPEGVDDTRVHEEVILEKLKYNHPPPYVMPPKKTLCTLLDSKRAKRSIHSLVSRFSIDSRLDVKKKGGFSAILLGSRSAVIMPVSAVDDGTPSKLIRLSTKKYLYSRLLPICVMPMRAINDRYIQDKDVLKQTADEDEQRITMRERNAGLVPQEIMENPVGVRFTPILIPLGPIIQTPIPPKKIPPCPEKKKRKCAYVKGEEDDPHIERVLCNTEDVLLELLFPNFKVERENEGEKKEQKPEKDAEESKRRESTVRMKVVDRKGRPPPKETVGFTITEDDVGIIQGNMCFDDRESAEDCHFKSCYFASMLCILAKIRTNVQNFHGTMLDQFVVGGDKIYQRVGKLRHKIARWFHMIKVLDTRYNAIAKQAVYGDPKNCQADVLEARLQSFFQNNSTGIIVFSNCSLAFWEANDRYYLFDPYANDEEGKPNADGFAALLEYCDPQQMLARIQESAGEAADKPYRIYTLCIAHMEQEKRKKKRKKKLKRECLEKVAEEVHAAGHLPEEESVESEESLIELSVWVTDEPKFDTTYDMSMAGFAPIKYYDASILEVSVLVNDITEPVLAPFRENFKIPEKIIPGFDASKWRMYTYDKKFKDHAGVIMAFDLCVIAWSLIHDPITWSVRTVRGLYEASMDYANDSALAAGDSSVTSMIDGLLPEFEIGNYSFRAVTTPLHYGSLYSIEGWNLAMSLAKLFEPPLYSGAIIVCRNSHVGVTKRNDTFFAWWAVKRTKNVRFVTSEDMAQFLKLVVQELGVDEEESFVMRIITISYAQKMDPDCSDMKGLHEPVVPVTSLTQVHKKEAEPYDLETIFKPSVPNPKPIFVLGTVALRDRDVLKEPRIKRCYFVAVLSVMVKKDIVQSPIPPMVDKVVEVGERVYREFIDPKFHTEQILRNVTVMNRIFDYLDCASQLVRLTVNMRTGRNDFYLQVRKHLRRHFRMYTCGILHFTNCCYGFWYSQATNTYYYLDPYQCNAKGRKVLTDGKACLCIFPTACQMAKQMCFNQHEDTTGFFIHRIHINSINVPPFNKFQEDPMWVYLDYHWSFYHATRPMKSRKTKKKQAEDTGQSRSMQQYWNNYVIEVSHLIYSLWGTVGSYDSRFGERAGKNQAGICVALMAMQYLSHPSRWNPAILDSAVICGDCYYTESLRSASRQCAKHFNRYNLQSTFRIFPNVWRIDFRITICGVLYGGAKSMTLTTTLMHAFEESPNILIECNKITLGVIKADDGFYLADSCWVGPPLFERDRGAIYVLRCRNMNALVYAATKIFNTNLRLQVRVTPLLFTFEKEDINVDGKAQSRKKKILTETVNTTAAKVEGPIMPLPGGQTVPDRNAYVYYQKNIAVGILKGRELENPELPMVETQLDAENMQNIKVSTTWHLNVGQADPLKSQKTPFNPRALEHIPEDCRKEALSLIRQASTKDSLVQMLYACDDYPRVLDFAGNAVETAREKPGVGGPSIPMSLGCKDSISFLRQESRAEFLRWNEEMADPYFKEYQHRVRRDNILSGIESDEDSDEGLIVGGSQSTLPSVQLDDDGDAGDSEVPETTASEVGYSEVPETTSGAVEDSEVAETTAAENSPDEE